MNNRFTRFLTGVFFLALASATGLYAVSSYTGRISELTRLEPAAGGNAQSPAGQSALSGAFSLTDHNGNEVTEAAYDGRYKLVFFGFTSCPAICPAGLKKMEQALDLLGPDGDSVQPLFVTVDPARDTPEVMKEYTSLYHSRLIGLTGSEAQIEEAKDSFKVYAAKAEGVDPDNYQMDHSSFIYLMAPDNSFVTVFGGDDSAASMADEIRAYTSGS